jgi:DNA-binding response OmpR family regulator
MNRKIFIIEDDINILTSLRAKLTVEGFSVIAEDGTGNITGLITKLRTSHPDYIILDLILPSIDGWDVVRMIKSDNELSHIPVLIFTNISDADSRTKGASLGIEYYFIKDDLIIDEFVDKVKKIILNREKSTH